MRAPRLDGTRAVSIGLVLLFVTIVAVKLRVVTDFHAPAGDGIGYHQLAHELRSAGRYAFGPGLPPTYARMPGWPVVVAAVDTGRGNDIETTLARGTYLNVLFDVLTALFALLIAREAGLGRATQLLAFFLVLASPLLLLDSCYLLRETFSTTIATAVFWLIARGHFRREPRWLIAAAGLIGAGMLVRQDLLALGLACVPAWLAVEGWGRKIRVALLAGVACAALFSPWPIRNLVRFGDPHLVENAWLDARGEPLPKGERVWVSSWVDDLDQGWLNLRLVNHQPITERDIHARAWDSLEEKAELLALFSRYNREGLSPAVDQAFRELGMRRFRERPLYRLAYLPLRRAALWWWSFPKPWDQPLRSRIVGQPGGRWAFDLSSKVSVVLGLLGWLGLGASSRTRAFAIGVGAALLVRTIFICVVAPDGGGQRYVAPTWPMLLIGAALLIGSAVQIPRLLRRGPASVA